MNIRDILKVMVERNASDIYLTEGLPAMYRIEGVTQPVGAAPFTNEMLETLAKDVMRDKQKKEFEESNGMPINERGESCGFRHFVCFVWVMTSSLIRCQRVNGPLKDSISGSESK